MLKILLGARGVTLIVVRILYYFFFFFFNFLKTYFVAWGHYAFLLSHTSSTSLVCLYLYLYQIYILGVWGVSEV
jgi:hypothetical protein